MKHVLLTVGFAGLLAACGQTSTSSQTQSLTNPDYTGKKYYFGWGMNDNGEEEMDNEVIYDVRHTANVFTKSVGGDYIGKQLVQDEVSSSAIRSEWNSLKNQMTSNDMYVQYSSGHGYPGGLAVGVDYDDIISHSV